MTAQPRRRRRRTLFGFVSVVALSVTAVVLAVIGSFTLVDSGAGEIVEADERPVTALPMTPNALLAVTDAVGGLQSLIVATLLPDGTGGSIVTIPVNADGSGGFGEERRVLSAVFDPADPDALRSEVEGMLGLTLQLVAVADPVEAARIVAPVTPVEFDVVDPIFDADTGAADDEDPTPVVDAGPTRLDAATAVIALTADPETVPAYDHHVVDVEVWSALAGAAPGANADVARDEFGRAAAPSTVPELFERLWSGPVDVRDLALQSSSVAVDGLEEADGVVLDRRDFLLVFGQVSPALLSTPNDGPTFRLEVTYAPDQLASSGVFETNSEAARRLIGELLFFQANVVSVDNTPAPSGAPSVTRVEIANEAYREGFETLGAALFGETEVVLADELIDGVDVVITIGTGYLSEAGG